MNDPRPAWDCMPEATRRSMVVAVASRMRADGLHQMAATMTGHQCAALLVVLSGWVAIPMLPTPLYRWMLRLAFQAKGAGLC